MARLSGPQAEPPPKPRPELHTQAWRNFKRMQLSACLFGGLIFALTVVRAFDVLPGRTGDKAFVFIGAPLGFFGITLVASLWAAPIRRMLKRYVWITYNAGFGQTPWSVVGVLAVLAIAAFAVYSQISDYGNGGRYPAGIFSAYAAGVALMVAQTLLCWALEREPEVRPLIER
jgi:hypothetical protein